ncbi:MAG: ATP-binding protein [Anaeromyxobacteraceae bacterium]
MELAGGEACLVLHARAPPAFNDAFTALWALSAAERDALGRSSGLGTRDALAEIVARRAADPAAFLAAVARVDPFGPEATRGEYDLADGRTIAGCGAPLPGADGTVPSRALFYRDVSRRRRDAEELSQRAVRQAAVARLGRIAVASTALEPLLEAAVGIVAATLGVPFAAVLELSPGGEGLVARAAFGLEPEARGERFGGGERTRLGLALLGSGPLVARDAGAAAGLGSALLDRRGVNASVVALIRGKERPYGVLAAYATEARPFVRDELGSLEAIAGVLGSAIARHQAEEATAEREALLRGVFDGTQDAMVISDVEGRILDANPAAEALLGTSRAELLGRGLAAFARRGRERLGGAQWARFLTTGREEGELELQPPGASPRSVEFTAIANILPGRHLTVMRDVTERRQLSARIALSDKMISVGTMAAGVAHELNNPLAYVAANLSFVADALRDLSPAPPEAPAVAEMARAVREAREGGERMRVIIRDLLALSRSDEATRGPVDVPTVLESCMQMAWNEIRHRAALVKDIAPVPPVEGNAARLSQVFLNLLVNAAQAIPEGAAASHRIRVSAREAPGGRVVIEVQDSGNGIAREDLPRIFDPFYTTKPLGVGTGLGLSICHNIVMSHGGEIEVDSEPGCGSTFRVVLKAAVQRAPEPARPAAAEEPRRAPRGRVLVVDDEPLVGVALRRALAREHDVVVTGSAREALALVRGGERFDILLSDLLMPEMTGMDLHATLAGEAPDVARRMVFLSGGAFTPAAREFLDANRERCIDKPFEVQALRELVRRRVAEARA